MSRARKLYLAIGLCLGGAIGVGLFTFVYARGASYLTNDPKACANCHVMQSYYDAWMKSSHHAVATCNDCHTPAGFIPKYLTKAENGFWHSYAFTTGWFPDPIRITPRNRRVAEGACKKCHEQIVEDLAGPGGGGGSCIRCHGAVGHPR